MADNTRAGRPPLALAVSLSPSYPSRGERGYPEGNASMAAVGLPSADLSMESILFELAMICFSLQTLLFSIIDLLCLLSPVRRLWPWFVPGAVKGPPETVWHCDSVRFLFMLPVPCSALKWLCLAPLQVGSRVRLRSVPLLTTVKASIHWNLFPAWLLLSQGGKDSWSLHLFSKKLASIVSEWN